MQILQNKNCRRLEIIFFSLIVILIIVIPSSTAEIISEIMYAPVQNENYNEWIEIYPNQDINLSGWKLCNSEILAGYIDHSSNGTLNKNEGLILRAGQYAIITDGGTGTDVYSNFNVADDSLALHTIGASLCGGLTNTGKEILLFDNNGSIIANVTYSPEWGAKDNNNSLQFSEEKWCEAIPTAGMQNNCSQSQQQNQTNQTNFNLKLKVYIQNGTSGIAYTSLFKIETNKDNCSIKDNVIINYNISNPNYFYQNSSVKEIGCSGYANTGYWLAQEGNFTICGTASAGREETNYSDNTLCDLIYIEKSQENETDEENQTDLNESEESSANYEYFISGIPQIINENNTNFTIQVRIINNKNESKTFDVWSYIYRGSKCYSQDREANNKTIIVNANSDNSTELDNQLNLEEIKENNNNYKFKVKILRTEIKTPKEFTYNITINLSSINATFKEKTAENSETKEEFLNGEAIIQEYASKSEKAKAFAPYIFAAASVMIALYMIIKRKM